MEESIQQPTKRRPFQFSLRSLFILTTVLAATLGLLFRAPPVVSVSTAGFFILSLPMVLVIVLIYGRGYTRTFCIGALFPTAFSLWSVSDYPLFAYAIVGPNFDEIGWWAACWLGGVVVLSTIFGLLAMGVRRLVESPDE